MLPVLYTGYFLEDFMLNFSVKARSESATKTVVSARNFEIVIDEPEDLGGSNGGANPV